MRIDHNNYRKNQQGMVSFLVTMIMMMVVTLIVIGFTQVTNQNRKDALDKQLSTQAFYVAESAINTVIKEINADPSGAAAQTNCSGRYTFAVNPDVKATCILVDSAPKELVYTDLNTLSEPIVATLRTAGDPIQNVTFTWYQQLPADKKCSGTKGSFWKSYPSCSATLHVDLTEPDAALNPAGLNAETGNFYLQPLNSPGGTSSTVAFPGKAEIVPAECVAVTANNFKCSSTINVSGDKTLLYARISSFYSNPDRLEINGKDINGSAVVWLGQVQIDVTAKAQDVLRRVRVRYDPFTQGESQNTTAAVMTGQSICKRFAVTDGSYMSAPDNRCFTGGPPTGSPEPGPCVTGTPGCNGVSPDGIDYQVPFTNRSTIPLSQVRSCTWNWGDGTTTTGSGATLTDWCEPGSVTPPHRFKTESPLKSCYTAQIRLTVTTTSGIIKTSDPMAKKVPFGSNAGSYCGNDWSNPAP